MGYGILSNSISIASNIFTNSSDLPLRGSELFTNFAIADRIVDHACRERFLSGSPPWSGVERSGMSQGRDSSRSLKHT